MQRKKEKNSNDDDNEDDDDNNTSHKQTNKQSNKQTNKQTKEGERRRSGLSHTRMALATSSALGRASGSPITHWWNISTKSSCAPTLSENRKQDQQTKKN
jgi:hypothetical protein